MFGDRVSDMGGVPDGILGPFWLVFNLLTWYTLTGGWNHYRGQVAMTIIADEFSHLSYKTCWTAERWEKNNVVIKI